MKTEHEALNDLDYLSQQGFAKLGFKPEDTHLLKNQIRMRTQATKAQGYFYLMCLLVGVFLGLNLFFVIDTPAPEKVTSVKENELELPKPEQIAAELVLGLDTVSITKENFIKVNAKIAIKTATPSSSVLIDSIDELLPKQIDLSTLNRSEWEQQKIRFIINSPVFYLHDLKISNYMLLYFKKNRYVPLSGIGADNTTNRDYNQQQNHLKDAAVYYLHDEIAKAMLLFKKGKYDDCLVTLNLIAGYNNEDINCDFYRGMCYYYKKNYAVALEFLEKCIGKPNNSFLQEADYYKALSLYEMGEREKAGSIFKQIVEDGEFYAQKAENYLRK